MTVMQRYMISRKYQRGLSFVSVVLLGVILVAVSVIVAKSVPIFVEAMAIRKGVEKAAGENSEKEVRESFERTVRTDNISSISGKNLKINVKGDRNIVIQYSYERGVKLFGPAYLVYRFNGSFESK